MTRKDYRIAFNGWHVQPQFISQAWHEDLTLDEAERRFVSWFGGKQIKPRRVRALGVKLVQSMLQKAVADAAKRIAAKHMLPEAREWLERAVPAAAAMRPRRSPFADLPVVIEEGGEGLHKAPPNVPAATVVEERPFFTHVEEHGKLAVHDISEFYPVAPRGKKRG